MLEEFLKDTYGIIGSDAITSHCGTPVKGTVLQLIEIAKRAGKEQALIDHITDEFDKASKARVLSFLGSVLKGFTNDGLA